MTSSRDRGKKQAGKPRPKKAMSDADFKRRLLEVYQRARQQNAELLAPLQQQQRVLLERLRPKAGIQ